MATVKEIQAAIQSLSSDEFNDLKKWIIELDWEQWDKEIEADSLSGKLDFLIEEALTAKAHNQLQEL
ncbi:hypothetical protein [Limnoraphis robusta]|uniref:Uncharacterized protein n=1 Tax=Limnoraphis robusta CCNP1315 TaxID=3110306 RepID=A0ABU5TU66_9CYAN|nr:hypothetical protein [Limnoraphis robusta]MEA5518440.1 hypothetical protein [Limnoraphis robusta CCNP1315]MEA5547098.1 hypothetical protein [Limnoraphis robusta CCNP1324]